MTNKADSKTWNEECHCFLKSGSQGFVNDIAALEQHILKLQKLAAKDEAGWMSLNALELITKLKGDVAKAKTWAGMV